MSGPIKSIIAIPAIALSVLSLAACGGESGGSETGSSSTASSGDTNSGTSTNPATKLFGNDFKGVCSGATVSGATAYDASAKGHKAVYFETWKNGDLIDRSSSLPTDWTVRFDKDKDVYREIDLVICAKRKDEVKVKTCDGYQSEGKETENKVNWHTATYDLTLVEATTGKTIAETSIKADDTSCPMFQSFQSTNETVDGYARPSDAAVADFMKPHMGK